MSDGALPPRAWTTPTIRDVAAYAGTSLKTVSRVINDEPGVSTELDHRVRAAITALDYRPNLGASNLRRTGGRTRSIGLVLANVVNPWENHVQRAIENVALERGFVVLSSSTGEDPVRERQLVELFTGRRVDGLVLMPTATGHRYLADQRRMGIAIVCVDRPTTDFEADIVCVDNRHGTATGAAHLIAHGHRRIGYLGARLTITTAKERLAGYRQALEQAALPVDPSIIETGIDSEEQARDAVRRMMQLADPPTAFFSAQNLITIGVVEALTSLGIQRSTAVVGFDDVQLFNLLDPAITVLAQHPWELGMLAAKIMFDQFDSPAPVPANHEVPVELICRGSGEIPGPFAR